MDDERVAWLVDAGGKSYQFKFAGKGVPYYSWTLNFDTAKDAGNVFRDEECRLTGRDAGKLKYLIHIFKEDKVDGGGARQPPPDPPQQVTLQTAPGQPINPNGKSALYFYIF